MMSPNSKLSWERDYSHIQLELIVHMSIKAEVLEGGKYTV